MSSVLHMNFQHCQPARCRRTRPVRLRTDEITPEQEHRGRIVENVLFARAFFRKREEGAGVRDFRIKVILIERDRNRHRAGGPRLISDKFADLRKGHRHTVDNLASRSPGLALPFHKGEYLIGNPSCRIEGCRDSLFHTDQHHQVQDDGEHRHRDKKGGSAGLETRSPGNKDREDKGGRDNPRVLQAEQEHRGKRGLVIGSKLEIRGSHCTTKRGRVNIKAVL